MKRWLVVGVETSVGWPTVETQVRFSGHELLLRPGTEVTLPSVELQYEPPLDYEHAQEIIRRFLSALCWVEGHPIREVSVVGGGQPVGVGRPRLADVINPRFRVDYLPEPTDKRARLALALYRDAKNVNSIPYQFLSFFKVLNVLLKTGPEQKDWIRRTLATLSGHWARERIKELGTSADKIAEYLYESGRCAVAHAFAEPLVDPDVPMDSHRLARDLPMIEALATRCIEQELGVKTRHTIWREHLYELEGFRALFGGELVSRIKEGNPLLPSDLPTFPPISIRLRDHAPFNAFEDLLPYAADVREGLFILLCRSQRFPLRAAVCLHFTEERLVFDPTGHVEILDDGSPKALLAEIDRLEFLKCLLGNGELEVWRADTNEQLGQCDPFIPVDIDFQGTDRNISKAIAELRAQIVKRTTGDA